jgi:hypothetical protein
MLARLPEDNRVTISGSPLIVLDHICKVYNTESGALDVLKTLA